MISSAWNYKVAPPDPHYMMSIDIPGFNSNKYGLLSGALFTSLFSITVLFSGIASDNFSRRLILSIAAMLWSVTSLTTSISDTYTEVALSRMMLGFFEAFCGPPAYSLIVDYFPPEVRTTANAVYAFGIYVGNALSSMIILMISKDGWRWASKKVKNHTRIWEGKIIEMTLFRNKSAQCVLQLTWKKVVFLL